MSERRAPVAVPVDMHRQPGHLIRRTQQVHTYLWATTVSREVTSTQFAVISVIAETPAIDQNSLAREAGLDTSTVGDVVNRLTARGYVARTRDPADRRRSLLELTDEGERVFAEVSVPAARMTELLVEPLSDGERRQLVRILRRLVAAGEALRATAEDTPMTR